MDFLTQESIRGFPVPRLRQEPQPGGCGVIAGAGSLHGLRALEGLALRGTARIPWAANPLRRTQ